MHHVADRPCGPVALLDQIGDFRGEAPIFKNHQVRVENRGIVFGKSLADPLFHVKRLNPYFFQSQRELAKLFVTASDLGNLDHLVTESIENVNPAAAEPSRCWNPRQHSRGRGFRAGVRTPLNLDLGKFLLEPGPLLFGLLD